MVNSLVPSSPYDGPVVVTPLPSPPPAAPPLAVQAERGRKRNVAGAKNGNGNVTASKEGVRWNLGPISGAAAVELGQASPDLLRASSPQMPRGEYQNSVRRTNGKRTSFVSRPTAGRDPEAEHSGQPGPPGPQSRRLLQDKIQTLQDELKSLKKRSKEHEPSVTYEVFHCIIGSNNSETVYHGEPSWVVTGNDLVLNASSPVLDHRGYIRYKRSLAFVVYKRYSPVKGQAEAKEALMQNKKLPKPEPITESIKIISDEMTDAFDFFVEEQEKTGTWSGEESRSMQAPYRWWYACRHKNVLNYHSIYERVDAQFKRGVVTSTSMEYLVRPGDILLQMSEKHIQTLFATSWLAKTIVNAFPPEKQDLNSGDSNQKKKHEWSWHAQGVEYTYTGTFNETVTIQEVKLKADSVEEEVKIVDLDVMPLRFAEEAVRAKLERRGKTFWNCREKQLVSYDTSIEDGSYSPAQRFMVDYQTYRQLHPNLSTSSYRRYENRMDKAFSTKSDKVPSEPEIYLCPAEIVGFDLRRKKWDDLQVDFIQDVVWNKEAFNRLEVDQETKELVQALVTNQLAAEKGTDWIQNKGNGLIMLLHGSPGTGKTFTAESVAEMAEKPLYTVTCGDIGTNPSEVEKYLGSVFYLGKIWGCVVLIDEAEVFLEQRSLQDLQRNALVSVFLRALEYYEGILILTSNRVGTFDEAFKSRIQLALHYDKLNKRQRNKIWRNFFNRLKALNEHNIDYAEIDDEIGDLADVEMNGRQIRNSITTARQLAQFKKEKMTSAHLRHAIKVASKFDTYLGEINEGVTDEEIARDGRIR
ncbi:hypothetical protein B0T17DRAFT_524767 [Bombardia bombarda]|uniref:AAA+ ATPase domain-containing protein n=1 Tax=Bombardia bombarda TaxID=252184 RepID=A0AA39X893_9PEZI|nr:hypothetical protein B0T17DRAFT_524767 [Bombardia bombarda]